MFHKLLIAKNGYNQVSSFIKGNAAVRFLINPPKCNCSFLCGKKDSLAKGKGNVYNNLLGNVLNNHILSAE